jgi:hypothetical protein
MGTGSARLLLGGGTGLPEVTARDRIIYAANTLLGPYQKGSPEVFAESIYRDEATGREWPMRELPPGAMFDAWWYRDADGKPRRGTGMGTGTGHDGLCLIVCLPPEGGLDHWHVDATAKNGPGWERTGTVPNVTANPSIQTPRYHGWLRNGVLVEC